MGLMTPARMTDTGKQLNVWACVGFFLDMISACLLGEKT